MLKETTRYNKPASVKAFEVMEYERMKQEHPNFKYWPKPCYKDNTANGLTQLIIHYCHYRGWHAERISSMGRTIDTRKQTTDVLGHTRTIGSVRYIPGTSTNGTADIYILKDGRPIHCEIKIGKDRQSDCQKLYQQSIEANGGKYIICKCFDDFIEHTKDT